MCRLIETRIYLCPPLDAKKAQFHLDFIEVENSTGFHAPQEAARILGESINLSRQGQNTLRGNAQPVPRAQKASLRPKY